MISLGDKGGKRKPSRLTPVSPTYQKFGNLIVGYFLNFFQIFIFKGRAATNGCGKWKHAVEAY
jgi:hypothetical protein